MLRWGSGLELRWHRVRIQAVSSAILTFYTVCLKPSRWRTVWFLEQVTTASLRFCTNHPLVFIPEVKYNQSEHNNLLIIRNQLHVSANIQPSTDWLQNQKGIFTVARVWLLATHRCIVIQKYMTTIFCLGTNLKKL